MLRSSIISNSLIKPAVSAVKNRPELHYNVKALRHLRPAENVYLNVQNWKK